MGRERPNVLLLMSDQHNPRMLGAAGHEVVRTPNLDRLAAEGTTFDSAYCTSPICVPARASLATGRYVHEIGAWDNAAPYTGTPPSWGHHLRDAGYAVTTIGKLHYRDVEDDTGFPDQRLPMHVHDGGDLRGVARRHRGEMPPAGRGLRNLLEARAGETDYTRYDRAVADEAVAFLRDAPGEPWALMVSFVTPHFPLVAPQEFFDLYEGVDLRASVEDDDAWDHPAVEVFRSLFGLTRRLTSDETRQALRAYLALCSFMDAQVGRVLDAARDTGDLDDTLVLYTSDHGESAGAHGLWFKHLMNEESAGVPLIMAGPGVPAGARVTAPVSHIDVYPTVLAWAGVTPALDRPAHGRSLLDLEQLQDGDRDVLAEYHANGTVSAHFMLRSRRYKYIEYVGERPQLFDLVDDPYERVDLAGRPDHAEVLRDCAARLRRICDPAVVDAAAKADQADRVERIGGVDAAESNVINFTPAPAVTSGGSAGSTGA